MKGHPQQHPPIDTFQIRCFLSVASHLNFTKAANDLFLSQPAISRKVAALEKELEVILIDRSGRELKLTEAGLVFRDFFTDFMGRLEHLTLQAKEDDTKVRQELRVGIFEGWNLSAFFRAMIDEFSIKHGNVEFVIDACSERDLIYGLKNGKYDAIIVLKIAVKHAVNRGILGDIEAYDFIKVHKKVFFSSYNPLAGKEGLRLGDFKDQTLYTYKSEIVPYDIITNKSLLKKYGIRPPVRVLSSMDAVTYAISTGQGFALFDDMARVNGDREFAGLLLEECHDVCVIMLKDNPSPTKDRFLEYCKHTDFHRLDTEN